MKLKVITSTILILSSCLLFSQNDENKKIKWIKFSEAIELQKQNPKTILIDVYTDWCGWCKKMDKEVFSNPDIAAYINANFYPVKFNAEGQDTIIYNDTVYTNKVGVLPNGAKPTHSFTRVLLNGRMSYPTIVYIDFRSYIHPVPGYMSVQDIEPLLIYFNERINLNTNYDDFRKEFNNTFYPDSTSKVDGTIKWIDLKTALSLREKNKKKILLYIHSEFTNGGKIMLASSFRHPYIANFINENYYPVKINFDTNDTIQIGPDTFINEKNILGYPHQFVIALLQPDLLMPAMSFFDEDFKLIVSLKGFFPPIILEKYINFITANHYKDGTDFMKYISQYKSKLDTK